MKARSVTDGLSNTLLIGERPPSNELTYGQIWAGAGDGGGGQDGPAFGAASNVLGVFERAFHPTATPDFFRPGVLNDPGSLHRYHFWSLHSGGAIWALADGSVQYLSYAAGGPQNTSGQPYTPTIIETLSTRASAEVTTREN